MLIQQIAHEADFLLTLSFIRKAKLSWLGFLSETFQELVSFPTIFIQFSSLTKVLLSPFKRLCPDFLPYWQGRALNGSYFPPYHLIPCLIFIDQR
jgi:hypothetical protein